MSAFLAGTDRSADENDVCIQPVFPQTGQKLHGLDPHYVAQDGSMLAFTAKECTGIAVLYFCITTSAG